MQRCSILASVQVSRRAVVTAWLTLIIAACCAACDMNAPSRRTLERLVRDGANRDEVARQLGRDYILYEKKDAEGWKSVERYWRAKPGDSLREMQGKVNRYPKVMYYTTAWTTTWVFLDEHDIARDYYQGSQ
jgi:hypothetical protein